MIRHDGLICGDRFAPSEEAWFYKSEIDWFWVTLEEQVTWWYCNITNRTVCNK